MASAADETGTTERMPRSRVIGYAMGDVANNVSFQMTSLFLMVYMTDIAGVPAAIAGTIYGVTKVWAGVTDLIAGNTVGRKETKHGRLRPWLIWVSPFLSISLVLLFSTPAGLSPGRPSPGSSCSTRRSSCVTPSSTSRTGRCPPR